MFSLAIAILLLSSSCFAAGPLAVPLGTAANYAILAKAGITAGQKCAITGDIGVSPAAATSMTGFGLILSSDGTYSTSTQVKGKVYAADYASPTPARLTAAIGDMGTAYTNASTRGNPNYSELANGFIGGRTLTPGLYKWTSAVTINGSLTISGHATDTWIFQLAGTLNIADKQAVVLSGGASAANIVWAVAGAVTLGVNSAFEGIILGKTGITMQTNSTINGRLLAQTAVVLGMATVTGA
ncbi:fungal antifreeze protein exerts hyperactivity By constructing an inequable beta-helix [Athelia psychrophila]|uniref:Fungal antifreeze protein exerts hyperactivity By constructing an inequable beta-helix n=1 Tax=Athelia psychrophila TaxID=1759441 RepID=A0A166H8H7_9AGAM|nr:fungal antifreeze protein exerts hyperactivity By constructing an inequable beta-helix [Fibularhizoctonia sp. CBS 109695]